MPVLYFVRHGETDFNVEGKRNGEDSKYASFRVLA